MMNRNNIYACIIASLSLIGLSACSSEVELTQQEPDVESGPALVKIKLNTGDNAKAMTRAESADNGTMASLDREKAFDSDNTYAVVFKNSQYYKTIALGTVGTGDDDGYYTLDMNAPGTYDIHIVANPDATLKNRIRAYDASTNATGLASSATPETLKQLIATQEPGADNNATDFLMTSLAPTQVTINGSAVAPARVTTPIDIARIAARIDIDVTNLPGFTLKKVVFKNRYASSRLMQGNLDMAGLTAATPDKEYDVDALTPVNLADPGDPADYDIEDQSWEGVIYAYENLFSAVGDAASFTTLTIIGEKDGTTISNDVVFQTTDGLGAVTGGIPLERNNLYTIILKPESNPDGEFGKLGYSIRVADWNDPVTSVLYSSDVDKDDSPAITEVNGVSYVSGDVNIANASTTVDITVESTQTYAKLLYAGTGDAEAIGLGVQQISLVTDDATGKCIQVFRITVPANGESEDKTYNFRFENGANKAQYTDFTVRHAGTGA